jgi:type I restriction enzyme R subunit
VDVALPYTTPGTDTVRFRSKAAAYLRHHEDHVALQRLRRNKQLTSDDVSSLERMLLGAGGRADDVKLAARQAGGLGLFIRGLVGLDLCAATEAFGHFLIDTRFTVDQIRFVQLIVDELTATGVMEPSRLFESPFTDHAPTGPDQVFDDGDLASIVDILRAVKRHAMPVEVA